MEDTDALTELNRQFIEAFRRGSSELLEPVLAPSFRYLDGSTGELWPHERYLESLRSNPMPNLAIDEVSIYVSGDTAVVSARTSRNPGRFSRYIDTYQRQPEGWRCAHACVWPLTEQS